MEFNNFRGLMDAKMQQMYHSPVKGFMNTREAIQREIEKEMIREEILAEEIARKRLTMAMEMAIHGQPFASGSQRREIGNFQAVRLQRLPTSSGDGKNKVIDDLGKLNDSANPDPPPLRAYASSSQLKHCTGIIGRLGVGPKKLVENSNKHVSKEETDNKSGFPYWCGVCGVCASSETNMNQHNEGKKHMKNLEKGSHGNLGVRKRLSGMKSKKTKQKQKSHKSARHRG